MTPTISRSMRSFSIFTPTVSPTSAAKSSNKDGLTKTGEFDNPAPYVMPLNCPGFPSVQRKRAKPGFSDSQAPSGDGSSASANDSVVGRITVHLSSGAELKSSMIRMSVTMLRWTAMSSMSIAPLGIAPSNVVTPMECNLNGRSGCNGRLRPKAIGCRLTPMRHHVGIGYCAVSGSANRRLQSHPCLLGVSGKRVPSPTV